MFCPACGVSHDESAKFCPGCGTALHQAAKSVPLHQPASDNLDAYYKAIIGPKRQSYYLEQFARFDSKGGAGISWHWPAFFATFYWFLYRKMWRNAIIYFFLPYIVMFAVGVLAGLSGHSGGSFVFVAYILYTLGIFLFPPMYANALYYKHCQEKIKESRATSPEVQRQLGELTGKGGTSGVILIFLLVFVVIAVIGILAAIAIPQYQEYVTRANTTEAVATGKRAADSVSAYYKQNQTVPANLAQTGFVDPLPSSVNRLEINNQDGTISITMAGGLLTGKSILLVPSLDANRNVIWTCMSKDIQDRQLPIQCRQKK
jgi:Tfp pilus assembly protein PilE